MINDDDEVRITDRGMAALERAEEERRRARSTAIAALDQARLDVQRYIECFASSDERVDLVGVLPELQELGRRFEWETNPQRDDEKRTTGGHER